MAVLKKMAVRGLPIQIESGPNRGPMIGRHSAAAAPPPTLRIHKVSVKRSQKSSEPGINTSNRTSRRLPELEGLRRLEACSPNLEHPPGAVKEFGSRRNRRLLCH